MSIYVKANRIELAEIREVMDRRANEVASFLDDYRRDAQQRLGSVELALSREADRLRRLSDLIDPELWEDQP